MACLISIKLGDTRLCALYLGGQYSLASDERADKELGVGQVATKPRKLAEGTVSLRQREQQPSVHLQVWRQAVGHECQAWLIVIPRFDQATTCV